ncbi:hypothetical protein SOVF_034550 [Spinacia oleracea]|nr:hypothetical protein SOVF_034550 [Spinacia oleracea]
MISIIANLFGIGRYHRGVPCDGGTLDNHQSELSSVLIQPQNKRRKVEEFLWFNTEYVDRIIGWLKDSEIDTIGVYGMGGVGKTTLATQLQTRLLNHVVAWVSVGVDFTVYKLQQDIAGSFGLDLQGDRDAIRRAAMISEFLCRNHNCVLFLDDLWGDFRREDVGIPRKCKLIVISRLLDVCRKLRCKKVVKVEPLQEEESWQLFNRSIGYGVLNSVDVCRIRKLVYDKCVGLPLAITSLATSLRKMVDDDNPSSWREVLENFDLLSAKQPHLEDTFSQLRLSYERLNNKLQRCFLYSALFPKGYAIRKEELIRVWIGMELIDDVPSLQARYNMGHSILNKLVDSCLLETYDNDNIIKINDLVRHMALSIAGDSYMVEAGIPTNFEFRENLRVVSLVNSSIPSIPSGASLIKCHCLSTLLLQHNSLEFIPESFFLHMRGLRVLNLSDTNLIRLPSSIDALEELRVLDLSFCQNLKQVTSLSKLLKLQFLNLSQTGIGPAPRSLENLKSLTELNLSSIPEPQKIPSGVLPALFRLKRLACYVVEAAIHELQNVNSLEVLDARFLNLCDLSSYVRSQHWCILESYHLQVGFEVRSEQPYNRRVSLSGCSLTGQEGDYVVLPSNIQELYVDNCRDFRCLSDVLLPVAYRHRNCQNGASVDSCNGEQAEVFAGLEMCIISRCQDVKTLFAPSWVEENLQSLELLQVENCRQVKEIIAEEVVECGHSEGKDAVISLPQLTRLVLTLLPQVHSVYKGLLVCSSLLWCTFMDCPKLKRLPFSNMDRLEWIEGQEKWWDLLEWDEPESKASLRPLFRCKSVDGDR